ncbi:trichodiene oxygenase [Boeremia exigua]|uniref:trichodiene oxygenase n=1 Tax=Boeremia exigua TaxID=749465 RepID=UPI001E8DC142|nr:trichodiene oxygenase [Boeremia exigua]KAH6622420.1 trichodiene oxygenase [Boeremia exigua]
MDIFKLSSNGSLFDNGTRFSEHLSKYNGSLAFLSTGEQTVTSQLVRYSILFWVAYSGLRCIYNVFFHPLRKIPGPLMAAMTPFPDFWYDAVKRGNYIWEIQKMHKKYGPIVRINPNEVHIDDPSYYQNVYVGGTHKVNKDSSTVAGFGVPESVAATVAHSLHRSRRGYMNPYFSKRSIVGMEPLLHERITTLLGRLNGAHRAGTKISLDKAFSAMTADIITQRFFGYHYDYLSVPDLVFPIREAFQGVSEIFHWTRFVPWAIKYLKMLPIPVIRMILPSLGTLLVLQQEIETKIDELRGSKQGENQKSVIMQALSDESIPKSERSMQRLLDEGQVIIFAGTETSSRALSVGMFYLLSDKSMVDKLRAELTQVAHIPETELTAANLEPLPYLTGVVKESIRLSYGPLTRLPRVFVEETLQYGKYSIPPGTPISQSTYFVHNNPEIFTDPLKFKPERWVEAAEKGFPLNNYLTSFTKGSRQCLGIGLAHAEMYLTIARVIMNVDMELTNTTADDVSIDSVLIIGQPKHDPTRGPGQGEVEVMVTRKL